MYVSLFPFEAILKSINLRLFFNETPNKWSFGVSLSFSPNRLWDIKTKGDKITKLVQEEINMILMTEIYKTG